MNDGLYALLTKKKWLVKHTEITDDALLNTTETIILLPEQIPVISYGYEWSFAMWQDAALLTLNIAITAIGKGMMLKDATPFNIQFVNGRPIFIDTLSFEKYIEQQPWIAYRQFCESFLAPLLLQQYCHAETAKLLIIYPDGIPLEVLISLLPKRAKWNLNTYLHVYLQATIKKRKAKDSNKAVTQFSKSKMLVLLKNLVQYISALRVKKSKTTWDDYYAETILSADYLAEKTKLVLTFLEKISFKSILDLGANDGYFSLLYKNRPVQIVAVDGDANCINELYLLTGKQKITNILPIINSLQNPSAAIGWNNAERTAFSKRVKGDVIFALALVHHLAIVCNVPLSFIAAWLAPMCTYLLIEFIPKNDDKVQLLLKNRVDIFTDYTVADFEQVFKLHFQILRLQKIPGTERILYLMKKH